MKRFEIRLIAAWSLALIVGCAMLPSVGPNYEEPKFDFPEYKMPDAGKPTTNLNENCTYEVAKGKEDDRIPVSKSELKEWWKRFDDPVLTELIESGLTNNLGFKMAQSKLSASEYELLGSYAAFLPKFDIGGGWMRSWNNVNTSKGSDSNGFNYNIQNVALDGNWEIDIFGGNRRLTEAAIARCQAARWTVSDAWVALVSQIGSEYVNLRTTQERIEVARINLRLQSETYEILKSRLKSGIGDELAVNQCAYIVEETRARIPQLLAEEERLKNTLAILAGVVPGALDEKLKPLKTPCKMPIPHKVAELKLDTLRSRPDVKIVERNLAAQTAAIGVAKSAWFPKLFITGSVGMESKNRTRLFSRDSFFATLGPSVSWPIFQGGAIYANVRATEAKVEATALEYEHALETAYGQVRDAYFAYTQEYHRNQSLSEAVKAATSAVAISRDLYTNGLRDFNNVLDAQRSRLQLEEQFVISRGQVALDLISLYKSLGGGLALPEEAEAGNK